jgi:hypothetical protein
MAEDGLSILASVASEISVEVIIVDRNDFKEFLVNNPNVLVRCVDWPCTPGQMLMTELNTVILTYRGTKSAGSGLRVIGC